MTPDTDWEARYRRGDTPWDKGAAHPALVQYLEKNPVDGRVLVLGSGLGYDVRALAAKGAQVTGVDIAPSAIRGAEAFPKAGKEQYALVDLFALPPEFEGRFDWVWEHTCFCAIDPLARPAYVRGVLDALKPDGHLLAVFYLDPDTDGGGPPFGVEISELDALFGPHFQLLKDWTPDVTYPERENRERMRLLKRVG